MKIAFAASEVFPFAKTGGLADVTGALPLVLEEAGAEIVIVMPGYSCVKESGNKLERVLGDISRSLTGKNIAAYFIEHQRYFGRSGLYQDGNADYEDNARRFAYYCDRTLRLLKEIDFKPDVIHLHDWQTALIPVYLRKRYAADAWFSTIRTLLTIHNLGYQGIFPREQYDALHLPPAFFSVEGVEFYGRVNLLKGGIMTADLINTVSPTYAREIQTPVLGFGLEQVLAQRGDRISGILNGLDYNLWNPETDPVIARPYSLDEIEKKAVNKEELQRACGLPGVPGVPLLGMVSRLAGQKGIDLILESLEEIEPLGVQMVIFGIGEPQYHTRLEQAVKRFGDMLSVRIGFDDDFARSVYAGSDLFLMPSEYEPCGLGQMISMRYGSLPIVFETGGLADTVDGNNGFLFREYSASAFTQAVRTAVMAFHDKDKWRTLVGNAMSCRFDWQVSARKYLQLYERVSVGG
ncbi:MAG: glycogen synthase GlgA [Candidatus Omnitrophica bacterium]|nr:glycogen synthase GlgA [Candidatus Omnitrophota bacterium]